MRCRQARRRLKRLAGRAGDIAGDRELRAHLDQCRECRREVDAVYLLDRLFTGARAEDRSRPIAMPAMRRRVEAVAAAGDRSRMGRWVRVPESWQGTKLRWVVASSCTLALVILAMLYFPQERQSAVTHDVVGYEVQFAGVQAELATDGDQLCSVFFQLGLFEADYDLGRCDSTCTLHVLYLKSREEAHQVINALAEMNRTDISADVIPVRAGSMRQRRFQNDAGML